MKAFIVLALLFPGIIFSQNQEVKLVSHNIIFGGLTAAVGAVINKKKDENWKRSCIRGFWQGSIGGLVQYSAKKTIHLVDKNNNLAYALPARLLSAAANSIVQNAAYNGAFLKNWNFEYGFLRFDFAAEDEKKFRIRLLPVSLIASAIAAPKADRLDVQATLLTGMMTFASKVVINDRNGIHDGVNYGRAFIYVDNEWKYHIISHEIIHEYQYREYLVINACFKKEVAKIKDNHFKKFLTKYIYPDIPYFGLFYMLEGVERGPHYFRNYFEFEAERFATNRYVPIN